LDGDALEQAVMQVAARGAGAQVLVVNKFGKLEAAGRGYVPLIVQALDLGLPVLVGVSALNLPDLLAFTGEMATPLPEDPDAISAWALAFA
jgi:hypothetical protein